MIWLILTCVATVLSALYSFIDNFITEMEKKASYPVTYLEFVNNNYTVYEYYDEGELFDLIKRITLLRIRFLKAAMRRRKKFSSVVPIF